MNACCTDSEAQFDVAKAECDSASLDVDLHNLADTVTEEGAAVNLLDVDGERRTQKSERDC